MGELFLSALRGIRKFASDNYRWRLEHPCEAKVEAANIADWAEAAGRKRMEKRWRRRAKRWGERCAEQGGPCE